MMIMSRDWVSSVSFCSIYIKSLLLEKLLKLQLPPLHKFKFPELKLFYQSYDELMTISATFRLKKSAQSKL